MEPMQQLVTKDKHAFSIGPVYRALVIDDRAPADAVRDLFSAYLAPHPSGFSGYFDPSGTGWSEHRSDHCGVSVLQAPGPRIVLLVFWQTDAPAEVTQRQMQQMLDAIDRAFPAQARLPIDELAQLLPQAEVIGPEELGLAEQNAGASRDAPQSLRRQSKPRRRLFGRR
jgi:hypothetical protein